MIFDFHSPKIMITNFLLPQLPKAGLTDTIRLMGLQDENGSLNSAYEIGRWVNQELNTNKPDICHILRIVPTEIDRWFRNDDKLKFIPALTNKPVDSGYAKWDALIEGIVAYHMNLLKFERPDWTLRTSLPIGWNPYEDTDFPPAVEWAFLDTLETPAELLDKGITFSQRNMEII